MQVAVVDLDSTAWEHKVTALLQVLAPALEELYCVLGQDTLCHGLTHAVVHLPVELLRTEVGLARDSDFNLF